MTTTKSDKSVASGILVSSADKPLKANCWSCGDMRAAHFCQQCGKVQPPVPVDYFTFFGLPYRLNLDTKHLEREFYDLSRHLHPDINAGSSDPEQEWSLEKSSQLNDAYRTLKDPILAPSICCDCRASNWRSSRRRRPKRRDARERRRSKWFRLICWRKSLS